MTLNAVSLSLEEQLENALEERDFWMHEYLRIEEDMKHAEFRARMVESSRDLWRKVANDVV